MGGGKEGLLTVNRLPLIHTVHNRRPPFNSQNIFSLKDDLSLYFNPVLSITISKITYILAQLIIYL